MRGTFKIVGFVFTAFLLAACAGNQIASDVARFHQLPKPSGESFKIVPSDSAKTGSLEFATYANLVSNQLTQLGYKPVDGNAPAVLTVKMDYSINQGQEKLDTRPGSAFAYYHYDPFYRGFYPGYGHGYGHGGFGYGGFGQGYGYDDPFYSQPEVYSYTAYTRKISMVIERDKGGQKLFEGRVESVGRDNRLPELMPYLVQAMFTGFPGDSGITKRVIIDLPKTTAHMQ